uniref:Reverse transcriptase Ty1/copia-type domain-containing protein n=1 Tax=Solanum lycopersicum TaxID=4081 RepID=A0A3Q7ETH7_SOLLC
MLIAAKKKYDIQKLKGLLSAEFEMKDLGAARKILGMEIIRDRERRKLFLSQRSYIHKVLARFGMSSSKPIDTPSAANIHLTAMFAPQSEEEKEYIGTSDVGLIYGGDTQCLVTGYSDSDYARDVDTRRSMTGYVFTLGGSVVSWKATLQPTVTLSTTEAEYMALTEAAKEGIWLKGLEQSHKTAEKCDHMTLVPYASAVGSLIPDIAHAVGVVSRYMANSGKEHWEAVKWLLRYLRGTSSTSLCFGKGKVTLQGFVDADLGGDIYSSKSTFGYIYTIGGTTPDNVWTYLPPYFRLNDDSFIYLVLYVDDMLIASKKKYDIQKLKGLLSAEFEMKDLGAARKILGMEIIRDRERRKLFLSQRSYIQKVLARFGMSSSKPIDTPSAANIHLTAMFAPQSEEEKEYIGTSDVGLIYGGDTQCLVTGYSDSDYAGDVDTRRSMTGYVFTLGGSVVSWKATLQPTVTLSTTEAEYMALTEAAKEGIWLKGLGNLYHLACHSHTRAGPVASVNP